MRHIQSVEREINDIYKETVFVTHSEMKEYDEVE